MKTDIVKGLFAMIALTAGCAAGLYTYDMTKENPLVTGNGRVGEVVHQGLSGGIGYLTCCTVSNVLVKLMK